MPLTENNSKKKDAFSSDWLLRGILSKLGDILDGFTGRKWQPSSSLATSELIERLKKILDSEVKDQGERGKFVPHNLKLKMQWDKFSTDSETALKKLENELLIAAVDHINDNRYQTYQPLKLEVKPDYFTEGVKLLASFEKFSEDDREVEVNVTVPEIKVGDFIPEPEVPVEPEKAVFVAEFTAQDKQKRVELAFSNGERMSVGRSKQNGLTIEDNSVSNIHAALVLSENKGLQVADTGSTNGTFLNGQRIAYGKAFAVAHGDKVTFGTVEVVFYQVHSASEDALENAEAGSENYGKTEAVSDFDEALPVAVDDSSDKNKNQSTAVLKNDEGFFQENDLRAEHEADRYVTKKDVVSPTEQKIVFDFEDKK